MKQRTLMMLTVVISFFILIIIGSVVRAAVVSQKAENNDLRAQIIKLQVIYSEREAQYNKLIDKANQDIQKANHNMQALAKQVQQAQVPKPKSAASAPGAAPVSAVLIPPDAAQQAAQAVALQDSSPIKAPELVNFEGQVAYEVTFDKGAIYVRAKNGEILFNGTLPPEISSQEAGQIALKYMGESNKIVQTDAINVNGKTLWRTIFAAGHMVYVDTSGQVVYVQMNGSAPIGG